jgi:hypothetical protein
MSGQKLIQRRKALVEERRNLNSRRQRCLVSERSSYGLQDIHKRPSVWFRSFRVKLSLMRMMHENYQQFTYRLRGLFSETQVCKRAGKVRISKALSIVLNDGVSTLRPL